FVDLALHLFQLSVAFDEFLCAASGEADREAPILVVAFDAHDGANSIARVANLLPQKRIRIGAAPCRRPAVRARARRRPSGRRWWNRLSPHASQEFFWRVRIFRIRFIAPR